MKIPDIQYARTQSVGLDPSKRFKKKQFVRAENRILFFVQREFLGFTTWKSLHQLIAFITGNNWINFFQPWDEASDAVRFIYFRAWTFQKILLDEPKCWLTSRLVFQMKNKINSHKYHNCILWRWSFEQRFRFHNYYKLAVEICNVRFFFRWSSVSLVW